VPHPTSSLSVVVPCYQEAAGVPALCVALQRFVREHGSDRSVDCVFVDDGSTDQTRALLASHGASLRATVVAHEHNRGLAAALRTGSEAARGELIGWLDADLSYDPGVLAALAACCDAGADAATASCHHPRGQVEGVGRLRCWLSRSASRLYRLATGAPLHTFTCMVRVHRRDALLACLPEEDGYLGVTASLLALLARGARVVEVPTTLRARTTGASKLRAARTILGHLRLLGRAVSARGGAARRRGSS
jgi:dolichol-phosphate mannosyltransferase